MEFAQSREELNALEAKYVTKDVIENPKCYNMITGGWQDNNPHLLSDEALARRSESIRRTYQEDSELSKKIIEKCRQISLKHWQDPEYAKKVVDSCKKFYKEHPEKLIEKGKAISKTINDAEHKDKHKRQWLECSAKGREALKLKMQDPNYRSSNYRYVLCETTGEAFKTCTAAHKKYGGHIYDVCTGVRKHTRDKRTKQKLVWRFIDEEEFKRRSE